MKLSEIKKLLPQFLEANNVETFRDGKHLKMQCPVHHENNPSAQINPSGIIHCHGCGARIDIFDMVGLLGLNESPNCFKTQLEYLKLNFNMPSNIDYNRESKPLFRGYAKNSNYVPLPIDEARYRYQKPIVLKLIANCVKKPVFESAYPFLSPEGKVNCVDFRVIDARDKKHVITVWYDGRYVRLKNPPNLVWGLDHIDHTKPCLIVEGAKCAKMAHERIGEAFAVHTWNRGSTAAKFTNWEPIYGYSEYYLLADMDQKRDYNGKLLPPLQQPGWKAMENIAEILKEENSESIVRIVETSNEAAEIKPNGADIVEMFECMSNDEVIEHILNKGLIYEGE